MILFILVAQEKLLANTILPLYPYNFCQIDTSLVKRDQIHKIVVYLHTGIFSVSAQTTINVVPTLFLYFIYQMRILSKIIIIFFHQSGPYPRMVPTYYTSPQTMHESLVAGYPQPPNLFSSPWGRLPHQGQSRRGIERGRIEPMSPDSSEPNNNEGKKNNRLLK